jgi:hypothetical protein
VKELGKVVQYFKIRKEVENDILFRERACDLGFPFATGLKVETARLPDGRGGGGAEVGGGGCDDAFWDTIRFLRGGVCPDGGGGATLRRAGEPVRIGGDSLADAALGRLGRAGRRGGAGGVVGEERLPSPPGVLRAGIAGATREGADDTGLVGGGGGTLPGKTDVPDPLRAGTVGGGGTLRGGRAGTRADGVDVACG